MDNWVTIISFIYPHEAHLAKAKLESEGIEVYVKDEYTVQVNNFYSNAIGGVKLQVKSSDFENAHLILLESGYIKEQDYKPNKFLIKFDILTSKMPLIGRSIIELRLLLTAAILLLILIFAIIVLTLPTTYEKLTNNSWCVDRIIFKGEELTPNSVGVKFVSNYSNCTETMSFSENGIVDFPGINSYGDRCLWVLKNDSIIISEMVINNNYELAKDLKITKNTKNTKKSFFCGSYKLEIRNNMIKMQSDSLTILGNVYNFNFRF